MTFLWKWTGLNFFIVWEINQHSTIPITRLCTQGNGAQQEASPSFHVLLHNSGHCNAISCVTKKSLKVLFLYFEEQNLRLNPLLEQWRTTAPGLNSITERHRFHRSPGFSPSQIMTPKHIYTQQAPHTWDRPSSPAPAPHLLQWGQGAPASPAAHLQQSNWGLRQRGEAAVDAHSNISLPLCDL